MGKLLILRGITGAGKTTVGKRLLTAPYEWTVRELDDLKLLRHGTTERCTPQEAFPEFGRQVRADLDAGYDVVAIEAFVDKQHIDWFLSSAGRSLNDPEVYCVWMECDVVSSLGRKQNVLTQQVVRAQHRRLPNRYRVSGELKIVTTKKSPDVVLAEIVRWCQISPGSCES